MYMVKIKGLGNSVHNRRYSHLEGVYNAKFHCNLDVLHCTFLPFSGSPGSTSYRSFRNS